MSNEEIAHELNIKKRTVECHINRIYGKCCVENIRKFYYVMRTQKIIGKRKLKQKRLNELNGLNELSEI